MPETEIRNVIDSWFERMYVKAVTLAQLVDKDIAKTNQQSQMQNTGSGQ